MSLLQIIAILVYILTLFFILFFSTNRFEKGWLKKISKTNLSGGYMYFRIICVVVVISFILLLKWLGV